MMYDSAISCSSCSQLQQKMINIQQESNNRFISLKKKIVSTDLLITKYKQNAADLSTCMSKLDSAVAKIKTKDRELESVEAELRKVKSEYEESKISQCSLEKRVRLLQCNLSLAHDQVQSLESSKAQLSIKVDSMEKMYEEQKSLVATLRAEIKEINAPKAAALRERLDKSTALTATQKEEIKELKSLLRKQKKEYESRIKSLLREKSREYLSKPTNNTKKLLVKREVCTDDDDDSDDVSDVDWSLDESPYSSPPQNKRLAHKVLIKAPSPDKKCKLSLGSPDHMASKSKKKLVSDGVKVLRGEREQQITEHSLAAPVQDKKVKSDQPSLCVLGTLSCSSDDDFDNNNENIGGKHSEDPTGNSTADLLKSSLPDKSITKSQENSSSKKPDVYVINSTQSVRAVQTDRQTSKIKRRAAPPVPHIDFLSSRKHPCRYVNSKSDEQLSSDENCSKQMEKSNAMPFESVSVNKELPCDDTQKSVKVADSSTIPIQSSAHNRSNPGKDAVTKLKNTNACSAEVNNSCCYVQLEKPSELLKEADNISTNGDVISTVTMNESAEDIDHSNVEMMNSTDKKHENCLDIADRSSNGADEFNISADNRSVEQGTATETIKSSIKAGEISSESVTKRVENADGIIKAKKTVPNSYVDESSLPKENKSIHQLETEGKSIHQPGSESKSNQQLGTEIKCTHQLDTGNRSKQQLVTKSESTHQIETESRSTHQLGSESRSTHQLGSDSKFNQQLGTKSESTHQIETESKSIHQIETESRSTHQIETESKSTHQIETASNSCRKKDTEKSSPVCLEGQKSPTKNLHADTDETEFCEIPTNLSEKDDEGGVENFNGSLGLSNSLGVQPMPLEEQIGTISRSSSIRADTTADNIIPQGHKIGHSTPACCDVELDSPSALESDASKLMCPLSPGLSDVESGDELVIHEEPHLIPTSPDGYACIVYDNSNSSCNKINEPTGEGSEDSIGIPSVTGIPSVAGIPSVTGIPSGGMTGEVGLSAGADVRDEVGILTEGNDVVDRSDILSKKNDDVLEEKKLINLPTNDNCSFVNELPSDNSGQSNAIKLPTHSVAPSGVCIEKQIIDPATNVTIEKSKSKVDKRVTLAGGFSSVQVATKSGTNRSDCQQLLNWLYDVMKLQPLLPNLGPIISPIGRIRSKQVGASDCNSIDNCPVDAMPLDSIKIQPLPIIPGMAAAMKAQNELARELSQNFKSNNRKRKNKNKKQVKPASKKQGPKKKANSAQKRTYLDLDSACVEAPLGHGQLADSSSEKTIAARNIVRYDDGLFRELRSSKRKRLKQDNQVT